MLDAHISHGIGASPFDSPLVHDSVGAELIVRAADCAPASRLSGLHPGASDLLERLRSEGLVVVSKGEVCTAFPVLLNDRQARYAAMVADVAQGALNHLSAELAHVATLVQQQGWSDWTYHFIWSQVFDSQVAWTEMMQRKLVPPIGHLIAWVVYPDHPFRSGTNYYPDSEIRDQWLMVSWRGGGSNTTGLVGASWALVYRAAVDRSQLSDVERAKLAELDLVDERGQLQVPVLTDGDPLLQALQVAARRYVDFLEHRMPLEPLMTLSRADRQRTFAMAYHDISWGILERLNRSGRLAVPAALERRFPMSGTTSMRGVAAVSPVYRGFADLIRAAIQSR
jgi:hypothetical protein